MLTKKQAKKLAQCLASLKQIKTVKTSFQDDSELLDLFTEVDTSLKETMSSLDAVEFKMVMLLYARLVAKDAPKQLPLKKKGSDSLSIVFRSHELQMEAS